MKPHRLTNREYWTHNIRLLVGYKSGDDLSVTGTVVIGLVAIVIAITIMYLIM